MMTETNTPIFDKENAFERVDDDMELFFELIDLFEEEYTAQLQAIEDAIASKDYGQLERESHAIKSAVGNLGAMRCYEILFALEKMGRGQESADASAHLEQLKLEYQSFRKEVEPFKP